MKSSGTIRTVSRGSRGLEQEHNSGEEQKIAHHRARRGHRDFFGVRAMKASNCDKIPAKNTRG